MLLLLHVFVNVKVLFWLFQYVVVPDLTLVRAGTDNIPEVFLPSLFHVLLLCERCFVVHIGSAVLFLLASPIRLS